MLEDFIISFKLKNTYRVNSIIYSIKQLPLINKILPDSLYENSGLKLLGNIVSIIIEIISIFIGKLIYILLMIFALLSMMKTQMPDTFIHMFTFLTICGALLNTYMFNPSKDKYYAMMIMNMDAKKYTLSNYYYALIKVVIGFLPFTLLFGMLAKLPVYICLLLPFFVLNLKVIVSAYVLLDYNKTKKARNENLPTKVLWAAVGILLLISYGLPLIGVAINYKIFLVLFLLSILIFIPSLIYINKFDKYKAMYKEILTPDNVYMKNKKDTNKIAKDTSLKQISVDKSISSNKEGFEYFHDLFVKRHKKILTESAKKTALVLVCIFIGIFVFLQVNKDIKPGINEMLLVYLPYFVFIMYMINKGTVVTQAMFMNCDHSMLTYSVFRNKKMVLSLFKERLKTLIYINLLPALVIATSLVLLLYFTGGTDNFLNYIVLFVSIISMSVFFSVHYLVMYYLLQPYNVNIEMKSATYKLVQTVTYFVCYFMLQIKLPLFSFGIATVIFSILYCLVSLYLVYKYAPKTFKLRL